MDESHNKGVLRPDLMLSMRKSINIEPSSGFRNK